ncbi:hypothetical protein COX95_00535 [bacterium CG_4_10_14_0_2_um_filter_33_32]|nr:MAG: hypothetical protein AUJ93_04530 [bacterium CG2_30_33_46]PIR68001.1 MAG: hypothetical protein COU50_00310 [bacterium CG10_big_fil_rev_8_21_14_0_10_33_18]PIU76980.1 MAG: hypothetical protein COS74_01200 [bacterium CG06_land_8_20_14_3_00_33_50]PIW81444.1 MAG: hypothetical protein COZ97_01745 [bacterium CG_4_8_14_3_um_filter_33_28]PIY85361.1 MAG: hypothetical protein COY76_02560 [bacterium CG_4_10_14_0_8_um_filter_33_57]PIZ86614.1 MAG: hypothetical protein COX95_00535 [bacterium CG_4_10_1
MENIKKTLGNINTPMIFKFLFGFVGLLVLATVIMLFMANAGVAGRVNGKSISKKDFEKEVSAQVKYQSEIQKIDLNSGDKKKKLREEIFNQMVDTLIISQNLSTLNVKVTQEEIDKDYEKISNVNGGDTKFQEMISNYYGLTKEEYKTYYLLPKIQKEKMQTQVTTSDEFNSEAKSKAENVLGQIKNGSNFADLAKKYSQDSSTSAKGGDIGWISKGQMVEEFEKQAFSLKVGEVSNIFKTNYGYFIIKVEEKSSDKVHVRQILIKGKSFTEWLDMTKKSCQIEQLVKF